jgi:hypothetical protein
VATENRRRMKNFGTTSAVHEYFVLHPGTDITISELREAYPKYDEHAIQNAISYLRINKKLQIDQVAQGRVWRYRPTAAGKPTSPVYGKRMFEELAVTKTGDVLIQDEEGKVYRAVEL